MTSRRQFMTKLRLTRVRMSGFLAPVYTFGNRCFEGTRSQWLFIVPDVMSGDIRGRQDPNEERKKEKKKRRRIFDRIQGLCESRGGRPGHSSVITLMVSVDVN